MGVMTLTSMVCLVCVVCLTCTPMLLAKAASDQSDSGENTIEQTDVDKCGCVEENTKNCQASESPYWYIDQSGKKIESDFLCTCKKGYGGFLCGIENPCQDCIGAGLYCLPVNVNVDGMYCYDTNDEYKLINTKTEIHWESDS